ncbi:MAG: hypothetical protein ACLR03_18845 [Roseburia inulinivorans]
MNQEPLPQIHLIRDTDLSVFAYELHIFAGDFLRECEFNMRSLVTNTGADSIAIMGKNHMWLSDTLFAYCSTADLHQMISTTEFIGARAFLFHTDRERGRSLVRGCPDDGFRHAAAGYKKKYPLSLRRQYRTQRWFSGHGQPERMD